MKNCMEIEKLYEHVSEKLHEKQPENI